jgi:hypothetical protein
MQYNGGDFVYDMGMPANTVYIIRRGTLVMETIFEVDDFVKIPIANTTGTKGS